jgi:hypothetical protein
MKVRGLASSGDSIFLVRISWNLLALSRCSDTFLFRTNLGQDTVTDFTIGTDVLEFRDGIFANAAAALAAATSSGSDTLITIDAGNSVLLKNVSLANLHEADFHIV